MYSRYFEPFPTLTTKRLRLRKMCMADVPALYSLCKLPESARFVEWSAHQSISETRNYVRWVISGYQKQYSTTWVIEKMSEKKIIGTCSFLNIDQHFKIAEVGYCLLPEEWGNGYASEAVWALLWYGFREIGFARIQARVMAENTRSAAVLDRLGFEKEGCLKNGVYCKNKAIDIFIYGITDGMYHNLYGNL